MKYIIYCSLNVKYPPAGGLTHIILSSIFANNKKEENKPINPT